MPEEQGPNPQPVQYVYSSPPANSGILKWILGGLVVLFMAGTSYYMSDARTRLANAEKAQQTAVAETAVLKERISKADAATQSVAETRTPNGLSVGHTVRTASNTSSGKRMRFSSVPP